MLVDDTKDLAARTLRGGIVGFSGQVIAMLLQIANVAIMSRLLAPGDFGVVAMAMAAIALVALFRELGLTMATVQKETLDQDTVSGLFFVNLAVGFGLMAIAMAGAPLAAAFYDDPQVLPVMVATALTIPLAAAGAQHNALLIRQMRWGTQRAVSLGAQALGVLVGIAAALLGAGAWALVANSLVGALALTALLWATSGWRPSRVRDWRGTRASLGFGLHLTGAALANYFQRQFDSVLVGWKWGAVELGYYSRAYGLLVLPQTVVMGPLTVAVIPALSRLQRKPDEWRRLLLQWLRLTNLLTFGAAAVVLGSPADLVRLMLGTGWSEAADLLFLLALSMLARAFLAPLFWIHTSLGTTRRLFLWQSATLVVYLPAFLVGVQYGTDGVAVAFSLVYTLTALPSFWIATYRSPITVWGLVRPGLPLALLAVVPALSGALWRLPLTGGATDLLRAGTNVAIAGALYCGGALLLVMLDPDYRFRAVLGRLRTAIG